MALEACDCGIDDEAHSFSPCGAAFVCCGCCDVGLELGRDKNARSQRLPALDHGNPLRHRYSGFVCIPACAWATHPAASRRRSGNSHRRDTSHGGVLGARRLRPPIRPGRPVNRAWLYDAALGRARCMVVLE